MLSRRSVRIKVMQLFFSMSRDPELKYAEIKKWYWKGIENTFVLFLFCLYFFIEITKKSEEDGKKRKSKHLPTDEDKRFEAKLFQNEIIQSLIDNSNLQKLFDKHKFAESINDDYVQKLYTKFTKEEAYTSYLNGDSEKQDHLDILLELFRYVRNNELFEEVMEDAYPNWIDDKSVIVGTVKKVIKILPSDDPKFYEAFYPDNETIKAFGETLLSETHKKDKDLLKEIKPILQNWDHERVAILDMIMIKMAITEFKGFSTIPTKVTLNEYVEIAKYYSTAKSKEFINGILDTLMKELDSKGVIKKEGRGLVNE